MYGSSLRHGVHSAGVGILKVIAFQSVGVSQEYFCRFTFAYFGYLEFPDIMFVAHLSCACRIADGVQKIVLTVYRPEYNMVAHAVVTYFLD